MDLALRTLTAGVALAALLLAAGCASLPAPRDVPPAAAPPAAQAAQAPTLDAEQRRLAAALRATPALVALDDEGALWVELPLAQAFAPGASTLQPALLSVLAELAPVLRRQPAARLALRLPLADGGVVLADRRAAQVRAALARHGVAPTRVHHGRAAPAGRALLGVVPAEALSPLPAARAAP
jgi:outer membrane protein OmpA-like peptidoglycan-associated protein